MKLPKIFPLILCCAAAFGIASSSCEDMLETDSDGYIFDDQLEFSSANDSLYSAMGILAQMKALGERYVLFGELRADLVSVPETAPFDFQNLSNFNHLANAEAFGSKRDFYSVINNCNIALNRMDTTIVEHTSKVMLPEYAAIRTIRAWTMLQVALTYGQVSYITEPVLTIDDTERTHPTVKLDQLVPRLIAELEPLATQHTPNYGNIDGFASTQFFIRPALLLADLYLYNGNYEQAAAMYYYVINDNYYTISTGYANTWTTSVRAAYNINHINTYSYELVAGIPYPSDAKKYHPNLVNLTYNQQPAILPAHWFIGEMNTALHFHIDRIGITNISGYLEGDLRGMLIDRDGNFFSSAFGNLPVGMSTNEYMITKFYANGTLNSSVTNPDNEMLTNAVLTRNVALYRIPHLYLRYAEAVNRTGKPTLAFAALKYGLRGEILQDSTKVNPSELADGAVWTNFNDTRYNENYGTAMRGRGLGIAVEATSFIIPELASLNDSIQWVEEQILNEMAAETAFEGNRFFDLLRISHHRPNHPQFMAERISRRFDNPAQIEARLSDINALWVK